jgi:hypothetical protein
MTSQDCLNHFDQNGDLDVDLGDAAEFLSEYGVP